MSGADTLEVIDLSELLSDEPECENGHRQPDNKICTHKVVYRLMSQCRGDRSICRASGDRCQRILANSPKAACMDCATTGTRRTVEECWKIIPI